MKPDRRLLEQLPDDALLPVSFVRALLNEPATDEEPLADLPVERVAEVLGRAPSTIRAWLHAGELEGYKLHGREWRVTRAALRAYQDNQAKQHTHNPSMTTFRQGRGVDLAAWRKVRSGEA